MTLIYPIISAILCALIEAIRIKISFGQKDNVNKLWTYTIAVLFFAASLALSVDYYDDVMLHHVIFYALYFVSVRGVIYDILLNILRGLKIDYTSKTTNSILDKIYGQDNFWAIKLIYFTFCLIFGFLWIILRY